MKNKKNPDQESPLVFEMLLYLYEAMLRERARDSSLKPDVKMTVTLSAEDRFCF